MVRIIQGQYRALRPQQEKWQMACDGIASEADTVPVLDFDELLTRCLGNSTLAARILDKFEEEFANGMEQLDAALARADAEEVSRLAHRLKGAAANVGAPRMSSRLEELVECGRGGQLEQATIPRDQLLLDFAQACREAASWRAEQD